MLINGLVKTDQNNDNSWDQDSKLNSMQFNPNGVRFCKSMTFFPTKNTEAKSGGLNCVDTSTFLL